jgi:plasmid stabilization system protein ParE
MEYRIKTTLSALASAETVYLRLNAENPQAAIDWFNGLFEAFDSLITMPKRCVIAPETDLVGAEVRCLYYRTFYRILFCVEADTVIIHHVRHTSRGETTREEFFGVP